MIDTGKKEDERRRLPGMEGVVAVTGLA